MRKKVTASEVRAMLEGEIAPEKIVEDSVVAQIVEVVRDAIDNSPYSTRTLLANYEVATEESMSEITKEDSTLISQHLFGDTGVAQDTGDEDKGNDIPLDIDPD